MPLPAHHTQHAYVFLGWQAAMSFTNCSHFTQLELQIIVKLCTRKRLRTEAVYPVVVFYLPFEFEL